MKKTRFIFIITICTLATFLLASSNINGAEQVELKRIDGSILYVQKVFTWFCNYNIHEIMSKIDEFSSSIFLILGLVFNTFGGFLLAIDSLGIKEAVEYKNDGHAHHKRRAELHMNAMINNLSVFMFVNLMWLIILVVVFECPFFLSLILCFSGYYLWKFIIWLSKSLVTQIGRMQPRGKHIISKIFLFPFSVTWLILYITFSIFSIGIEFFIDIPFRYIGEKVISKIMWIGFEKITKQVYRMERAVFKTPVLMGALLLFVGFFLQLIGTLLSLSNI